jgi:hypothetical protein
MGFARLIKCYHVKRDSYIPTKDAPFRLGIILALPGPDTL